MTYCKDPRENIIEIYTHGYQQTYSNQEQPLASPLSFLRFLVSIWFVTVTTLRVVIRFSRRCDDLARSVTGSIRHEGVTRRERRSGEPPPTSYQYMLCINKSVIRLAQRD